MNPRMASFRAALLGSAIIVAAACSKDGANKAQTDSSLARDLALASAQPAQPTFQDTAIAPAPTQAGRAKAPPEPVRTHVAARPSNPAPRRTQPAPPPQQTQAPAPAPVAVAPAPAPVASIASGTGMGATSSAKICTTALPGEKFVATINNEVSGANGANIPLGSTAVIEVASASGTDENATINFRVKAIVVGDKSYPVDASAQPEASYVRSEVPNSDPNADKKKVIGGAIVGGILGQMIGHNTKGTIIGAAAGAATGAAAAKVGKKYESCLPAGAQFRVTLNSALVMS
jgi:hypothetical protein